MFSFDTHFIAARNHSPNRNGRATTRLIGFFIATFFLPAICSAATSAVDKPPYGVIVTKHVPVVMDDGATLYADIGYPADLNTNERASGKFPVLLTQSPYNIPFTNNAVFTPDKFYVSRGYIYVVASVRGTGASKGPHDEIIPNTMFGERGALDGAGLVQWVSSMEGSDGSVGLIGCSFLGITQVFTAAAVGPSSPVKAISPACAGNGYETYMPGGARAQTALLFDFAVGHNLFGLRNFDANVAFHHELFVDMKTGGDRAYNRDYWQIRNTARVAAEIVENGIPAFLWSGWNATELGNAVELYVALQNAAAGKPTYEPITADQPLSGRYQIQVGPGFHGLAVTRQRELEWFDHWLKGKDSSIDQTTKPMRLFEMESGRWISATGFPFTNTYTPFYLNAQGGLSSAAPEAGQDSINWGVPSEQGNVLTYTSQSLSKAQTIAGPIATTVWASSSNTNLHLVASLLDVSPKGNTKEISYGSLVGSLRAVDDLASWRDTNGNIIFPVHPFSGDDYLTPGQVVRLDIKLNPTVWAVRAGHSLRLVLRTQNSSKQCGASIASPPRACGFTDPQLETLPGVYQIERGGVTASAIYLPLLNPADLTRAGSGG